MSFMRRSGRSPISTSRVVLATALLLGIPMSSAAAPAGKEAATADLDVLIEAVRSNSSGLVAASLQLTPDETAKFKPLYDRYRQEMQAITDRLQAVVNDYIANYRDLSNDKALQILRDYLASEADRIKLRQTYLDQFAAVLPGRTVARFYQIENKFDAILRYDLAARIPVVEDARGAQAK